MKINMFIKSFMNLMANGENPKEYYDSHVVYIPTVVCKDGFRISIQAHNGSLAASENGYRQFGENWHYVEWAFPSEPIDADKYHSYEEDTTQSNGCVVVELIDELLDEHGGIDLEKTMEWSWFNHAAYKVA